MTDYSKMTDADFDCALRELINEEYTAESLLSIPGIYEILSEYLNNEILDRWANEHPELASSDEEEDDNE